MQVKMTSSAKPLRGFTLTVLCPGFTDRTSPRFESWVYHITKWRAAHLLGVSDSRKSPTFPVDEDLPETFKDRTSPRCSPSKSDRSDLSDRSDVSDFNAFSSFSPFSDFRLSFLFTKAKANYCPSTLSYCRT